MTDDSDFKAFVRARMSRTGESYAAARAQLRKLPDATGSDQPEARRALLAAYLLAMDRATDVVNIIQGAETGAHGTHLLMEMFGWSEAQAAFVMNMSMDDLTRSRRQLVEEEFGRGSR